MINQRGVTLVFTAKNKILFVLNANNYIIYCLIMTEDLQFC